MANIFKIIKEVSYLKFIFINIVAFFSALLEIVAISLFIPILSIIQGEQIKLPKSFLYFSNFQRDINIEINIHKLLIFISIFFVLKTILLLWSRYYSAKLAGNLIASIRISLLNNLLNSYLFFTNKQKSGNLMSIIGEHANKIGEIFFLSIQLITLSLTSLLYFTLIIIISWELTFTVVLFSLLVLPIIKFINDKAYFFSKSYLNSFEKSQQFVMESLAGKKFLKATGSINFRTNEYTKINKVMIQDWVKNAFLSNSTNIILQPFSIILLSIVLLIYPFFEISLSLLAGFFIGFLRFVPLVQSALSIFTAIKSCMPSLERIDNMLHASKLSEEKYGNKKIDTINNSISFRDVSFRYEIDDKYIFEKINLTFKTKKLTGIKGPSGSGKSTLVDLLLGLYKPERGKILIDKLGIEDLDLNRFRKKISYISQEPFLINDTIKNNLLMGIDRIISENEIKDVLNDVGAMDFIENRGLDIHTIIGDRGLKLSGGQKQRLILARALLKEPILLILDEATSALDHKSEIEINKLIKKVIKDYNLTAIMISHKEGAIKVSDEIFEIKNKKLQKLI